MRRPVTDRRDWTNQIHVGQRWIAHGTLSFD
jgi:CRISPR system Cascade subunit CasD